MDDRDWLRYAFLPDIVLRLFENGEAQKAFAAGMDKHWSYGHNQHACGGKGPASTYPEYTDTMDVILKGGTIDPYLLLDFVQTCGAAAGMSLQNLLEKAQKETGIKDLIWESYDPKFYGTIPNHPWYRHVLHNNVGLVVRGPLDRKGTFISLTWTINTRFTPMGVNYAASSTHYRPNVSEPKRPPDAPHVDPTNARLVED